MDSSRVTGKFRSDQKNR